MLFLIICAALLGGTLLTYTYDKEASLWERLCAGAILGSTIMGLVCLALASLFGLSFVSVALAALTLALPLLLLRGASYRMLVRADLRQAQRAISSLRLGYRQLAKLALCLLTVAFFYCFFRQAVYETPAGLFTGVDNNYLDLTVHIGIVSGFVYGDNFPPIHPHFAGARLAYPFLIDFMTAMLMVAGGISMSAAMLLQNMVFSLAMVGILYRWAKELTRDRLAALLALGLILFYGGVGWVMLVDEIRQSLAVDGNGVLALLGNLSHNYTVLWGEGWGEILRFGNSLTTLFLPQRSFLLGLPIFIVVWTIWWQLFRDDAEQLGRKREPRVERDIDSQQSREQTVRMMAAGAVAGLLPLAHAHSFLALMGMGGCLALLTRRWRLWIAFFAVAICLAAPQILWVTWGSSTQAQRFAQWHVGWMKGDQNFLLFWFKNTGLFIPLLIAALVLAVRGRVVPKALLVFYLPFLLCFIVPNLMKLAPWEFDNIKVLFYWYVASVPLVALLLTHMLRSRNFLWRAFAGALTLSLVLAGCLDVWRVLSGTQKFEEYDQAGLDLAELIREATPPRAVILNAPVHNHPVLLAGRRSTLGMAETVWTHGIDSEQRRNDVYRIYEGAPDADKMLTQLGVQYAVVGPIERERIPELDEQFFSRFRLIGEAGGSRLYEVNPLTKQP
ncbi:MAG: hypothetical protein WKF30_16780 [Pyrinomonadaceae bacterium]